MNRSVLRLVAGILVALVLVAGLAGGFFWWKLSGLKEQMVHELEKAIGAQVQITSLDLDLWKGELHAAGLSLTNNRPSAPWEKGEISQVTVRFHVTDLFASTLPLSVDVSSWSLVLHPATPASDSAGTPPASNAPVAEPAIPARRVEVTQLSANEGTVEIDLADNRKVLIHGVSFVAANNGAGVWSTLLQAASITAGSLQAGTSSVQIRGEQDKVTFSNLRVACDQGLISGDGEMALDGAHQAQATLKATDVPVTMLVAVQWQMKLSGLVTGDLTYTGNDQAGSAKGQLALNHAKFTLLPWLGKVTVLVGLPDITDVEVDKATTDFEWNTKMLHLSNLDVRKNDVTRLAGTVDVDPTGQVDGKLKLGLPSSITSKWPQLQDKVFPVQLEEFNWADVHVTGTADHLQEDLTSRLLAAGVGQGTDLLDQAKQKAGDLLNSILGK